MEPDPPDVDAGAMPATEPTPTDPPVAVEPTAAVVAEPAVAVLVEAALPVVTEPPPPEPPPTPWRFWPTTTAARITLVVFAAAVLAYTITCMVIRYAGMFDPWAYDGDQPQAVWHYWRYHVKGALPPGDLMTDYAFVMHAPPVWWAMMAGLSLVFVPVLAAKILNIVAVIGTCVVLFVVAARRSNAFVGLACVLLMMRAYDFTGIVAGGYARSFGPMLTIAFIGLFFARRHRAALAFLVFQAAFYPSVVIPCGLAYGAYTVIAGPMRMRVRRMAGMLVAGLLIIGFGKFQDLAAPAWWGPVVSYADAEKMPAWHAGGRVAEVPMRSIMSDVIGNSQRAFQNNGHVLVPQVARLVQAQRDALALCGVLVVACVIVWVVRRRRGKVFYDPLSWEMPALFAAAFVSYMIARQFAFKLYLPYRPLQHVWPYMIYLGLPVGLWCLLRNLLPWRLPLASGLTVALSVVPAFLFFGDGFDRGPKTYMPSSSRADLYKYLRTLPLNATLAGEFAIVDRSPLFAYHRSYVMRNLAHPFRAGYYNETERRIVEMYKALYSSSWKGAADFCAKEKIDYLVYRPTALADFDSQIFQGARSKVEPTWRANKKADRLAMMHPPAASIIKRVRDVVVIDAKKLAVAAQTELPPGFIGPRENPDAVPDAPPAAPRGARALPLGKQVRVPSRLIGKLPSHLALPDKKGDDAVTAPDAPDGDGR